MHKPYYQDEYVTIYHGDCREILPELPKVDLVLTDPPYNINKADWDKIPNYIEWCGYWLKLIEGKLADNGSFYLFHNQMLTLSELIVWLKTNTKFIFKQFIVWNKRFNEAKNKGFLDGFVVLDGLRNYQQMAEYILFYTFQDETGLTTIKLDRNNFTSLRQYFKDYQEALGLNKKQIMGIIGQSADHCFRWGSSQWDMPTEETYLQLNYLPIQKEFIRRDYEDLRRDYEDLRRDYEDLRYTFNNQKTHHSVWDYEIAERIDHATPKPVDLLENIIRHSSNETDLVLDPFLGSGTTAVAAKKLNRQCIGIEIEEKYCEIAAKRCSQTVMELNCG
jgi:site-specific DNA-methyltransferase (adenine-specific)